MFFETLWDFEILGLHVKGLQNVLADAFSRFEFFAQFRDPHPDKVLKAALFRKVEACLGPFSVEAFTEVGGLNGVGQRFCASDTPPFENPSGRDTA